MLISSTILGFRLGDDGTAKNRSGFLSYMMREILRSQEFILSEIEKDESKREEVMNYRRMIADKSSRETKNALIPNYYPAPIFFAPISSTPPDALLRH